MLTSATERARHQSVSDSPACSFGSFAGFGRHVSSLPKITGGTELTCDPLDVRSGQFHLLLRLLSINDYSWLNCVCHEKERERTKEI